MACSKHWTINHISKCNHTMSSAGGVGSVVSVLVVTALSETTENATKGGAGVEVGL